MKISLGCSDHGRKLIKVADEDHLHAPEPFFPARPVQAQEFFDTIEEIGAHHGHFINDDRVKLPVNIPVLPGDLSDLIRGYARLETEERVDGLTLDVERGHTRGCQHGNVLACSLSKVIKER